MDHVLKINASAVDNLVMIFVVALKFITMLIYLFLHNESFIQSNNQEGKIKEEMEEI